MPSREGSLKEVKEWENTIKENYSRLDIGNLLSNVSTRYRAWFVHYAETYDAEEAAKRVGYKRAKNAGNKILNDPLMRKGIEALQQRNLEANLLKADEIQAMLVDFIKSDITDAFDQGWMILDNPKKIPKVLRQWMTNIEVEGVTVEEEDGTQTTKAKVKFKLVDKLKALDMLNRMIGAYMEEGNLGQQETLNWDMLFAQMENQEDDKLYLENKINEAGTPDVITSPKIRRVK